ncbi:MAG: hypothetical protein KF746_02885 [Chitinophagaceae bacterium]|nr:hypothetical protein [Chitinophagaceae bacterium]
MKNILIAGMLLLAFTCSVNAQQKVAAGKAVFHSVQQVSLTNGNNAVSAGIQSVNGFAVNGWFAGVGVGLDFYRYRSVPLFLELKKEIPLKKNALFFYADGGYNIPWVKNEDQRNEGPWGYYEVKNHYNARLYFDGGLGYAIQFNKGNALLLSAGYSHKAFNAIKTTTNKYNIGTPQETENTDMQKLSYRFNRLMLKVGWQF